MYLILQGFAQLLRKQCLPGAVAPTSTVQNIGETPLQSKQAIVENLKGRSLSLRRPHNTVG